MIIYLLLPYYMYTCTYFPGTLLHLFLDMNTVDQKKKNTTEITKLATINFNRQ